LLTCSSTARRRYLGGGGPHATLDDVAALLRASAPPSGSRGGRLAPAVRGSGAGWCSVLPASVASVATRRELWRSSKSTLLVAASSSARADGQAAARCGGGAGVPPSRGYSTCEAYCAPSGRGFMLRMLYMPVRAAFGRVDLAAIRVGCPIQPLRLADADAVLSRVLISDPTLNRRSLIFRRRGECQGLRRQRNPST